jgi:membrane protein
MKFKDFKKLFLNTFKRWQTNNISHLAAGLSYYTIFSLVPLLVMCISFGGSIFGHDFVYSGIFREISDALGKSTANQIQGIITTYQKPSANSLNTLLSIIILIWGGAGFLAELQNCFNTIWNVQPKPNRHWYKIIKDRFLSFTVVIAIALLLLISLVFSTFITRMSDHLHNLMPAATFIWQVTDILFSLISVTLLFAVIFKILPDVIIKWRDVFFSAFVTAIFFTIGKYLLTLYIAKSNIASYYGFTSSIIILLVWVYYSSQILLLGTAFTKVYQEQFHSEIKIDKIAKYKRKASGPMI